MVLSTKDNLEKEPKMVMVNINGKMAQFIKVSGKIMNLMEMVITSGVIKDAISESGR